MPAAERAEPAAGHRACPGTAAGAGTAGVPRLRALFSQKGICWLQGAAAGTRKMPWTTVCKQLCCCGRQGVRRALRAAGLTGRHCMVLLCPTDILGGQIGSVPIPGTVSLPPGQGLVLWGQ